MRLYDYKKAIQLIETEKENLKYASLGMHQDWWWTANDVWVDGKFKVDLTQEPEIAGINGSDWATPALELVYKDGKIRMLPCFVGDPEMEEEKAKERIKTILKGPFSSVCQENIPPLETA